MKVIFFLLFVLSFQVTALALFRGHKKVGKEKDTMESIDISNRPHAWAHLEGRRFEEAERSVLIDRPDLKVIKVSQNSPVTMDFRDDRVRIFVDDEGKVVGKPAVG